MFGILKTCKENILNIESKLKVFDTYVASVLHYGAEVCGFYIGKDVEPVHTRFSKLVLRVFSSTPNFMIYTELGRLHLIFFRKLKILKY